MPSFVTATMSRALDAEEEAFVHASLVSLSRFGQPIFTAHGQSTPEFCERLDEIRQLRRVPLASGYGPLAQVRCSLEAAAAHGSAWVLYTEPDKGWFFEHRLREVLQAGLAADQSVGIVMPSRDAASFATFPEEQQWPERLTNELIAGVLGQEADFLYGPFLLRPELVAHVRDVSDDLGWGWRPYLMAGALRLGWKVVPLSLDLPCPEAQRSERKLKYRLDQMAQNVRGLSLGLGP